MPIASVETSQISVRLLFLLLISASPTNSPTVLVLIPLADTKLATAKNSQGVPAKELADAKRRLQDLQHSVRVLQRERDAARDARDQARRESDSFQRDLDAARGKLSAVAAAVGPTSAVDVSASGPAAVLHSLRDPPVDRPTQDSPVGSQGRAPSGSNAPLSPSRPKRPRSSPESSESSPTPPAKRRVVPLSPDGGGNRGSKSPAEGSGSSPVDLTQDDRHLDDDDRGVSDASDAGSDASSGSNGSGDSRGEKDAEADSGGDEEEDEDAAEVADDLLEAQTLQALAQSRSAERRRRQASPRRGPRVAGSGASPDGSDGFDSYAGPAPRSAPNADSSEGAPASPRRRPAGSSTPDPMRPVAPFGPEELCIPGRAQARALIQREVDPWLADHISDVAMVTMLINVLFPVLPTRPGWLFPRVAPADRRQYTPKDYCVDLITEHNVRALLDTRPWEVLERAADADALSFEEDVGGRLGGAIQRYQAHEPDCLQSYWEATHSFDITPAMITRHPWLGVYKKERNNRRSHAGAHWKSFLEIFIPAMREGWCDLDLLLDPFFLHFPKRSETVTWYPGLVSRQANLRDPKLYQAEPTDLLEALNEANSTDPWRNHFRDTPDRHPARSIARLESKFFVVQAQGTA
ncbi:hypothetical protein PF005_g21778 [Phytophthora fragariae]|uniref:Uncharacterized protein n=1 Tax=Phytophthora fragariae TaxID=53985 RepID=A0A6A3S4P6_9STRA|nr:hypothetical protein PF003_g24551 [Phytophthora fragariae]KAE8891466.1 hypothetical protein PF003_g24558 [Phytophthora fragariae]KAE8920218.1 hypothetical protein PF009_g29485 [Phytophthora fragariae]KAE8966017.1 hypothetical protein PF011_g28086 [Phytophthora fragariae]KAE9096332.1 hypothetical protein PF007_g17046 [Phytophthora fragariae]